MFNQIIHRYAQKLIWKSTPIWIVLVLFSANHTSYLRAFISLASKCKMIPSGLLVLLLLLSAAAPSAPSCPRFCSCMWRKGKETVICRAGSFTSLPRLLNSNTQVCEITRYTFNTELLGSGYDEQFPVNTGQRCIFLQESDPSPGHFLVSWRYSQTQQIYFPESDQPSQAESQPQQSELHTKSCLQCNPWVKVTDSNDTLLRLSYKMNLQGAGPLQ